MTVLGLRVEECLQLGAGLPAGRDEPFGGTSAALVAPVAALLGPVRVDDPDRDGTRGVLVPAH